MIDLIAFDLFNYLEPKEIEDVLSHVHHRNFRKKTQIVTEGDDSHSLYFLLEGKVKVYLNDKNGKEIIINTHVPGDFFGELGLVKTIPRTASVMTLEECKIGVMQEFDFKHCLSSYPAFSIALIENLSTRLIEATETIRKLGLMDVYQRIAVTFLTLSEERDGVRVIPEKLTQQNIASRVGASREMVARILKDLRVGGYITQDSNSITINRPLPHSW
ncbi:MAG: Crp/Fnr family transcriptional regulator [Kangiella sp.]|nr:MAG: Crp/Fnr family transcriptional regulator [Gammaproteobacteria bacterium]PHS14885.1 MAG: Crp/Fnr family transcriptional regulator [Kangiella sp.]